MPHKKGKCGKTKKQGCRCSQKGGSQTGGSILNKLINKIPSSDKTARPRFEGEKHMILKLGGLKTGIANYCGPGTRIFKRTQRGDPPRTYADGVCNVHDIDFTLSGGDPKKVRLADLRMLKKLKQNSGKDNIFNIGVGRASIGAKVKAEDIGFLSKGSFGISKKDYLNLDPRDIAMLKRRRQALVMKGYGLKKKSLKPCRF